MNKADEQPQKPGRIRVKFISMVRTDNWLRHFPGGIPVWGHCDFCFDREMTGYDWVVVYDDLRIPGRSRNALHTEHLTCPAENTLLVTTEPSSIKTYGTRYTAQFGHVLTSQAEWALPHHSRIYSQPALTWFYGVGKDHALGYDEMHDAAAWEKTRSISTVCSAKKQTHTLHNRRYKFTRALGRLLPELDVYGHGIKEMDDKAEALHDYRYHIAIENHRGLHHWTEKLADPFLALSLPFYYGCTNVTDYFPAECLIEIDIGNVEQSAEIIRRSIEDNEYEKRLPFLLEARRRVLEEYNLFAVLAREIELRHKQQAGPGDGGVLLSRRSVHRSNLFSGLGYLYQKSRNRLLHRIRSS